MGRDLGCKLVALLALSIFPVTGTLAGGVIEGHFSVTRLSPSSSDRKWLLHCISACVAAGEDSCWHGGVDGSGQCIQRPAALALPSGLVVTFASTSPVEPATSTTPMTTSPTTAALTTPLYNYTLTSSGCQCFFDTSKSNCACCRSGGCQCFTPKQYACVRCGDDFMCSYV